MSCGGLVCNSQTYTFPSLLPAMYILHSLKIPENSFKCTNLETKKKNKTNFGENKPIARELKLKSHENLMNHMSQSGTGYFCRTSTVPYIKEAHEYNSKPTYDK